MNTLHRGLLIVAAAVLLAACSENTPITSDASRDRSAAADVGQDASPEAGAGDSSPDVTVDAGPPDLAPDAGPLQAPFGPAKAGSYLVGSSFAQGIRGTIQTLTKEAGLTVSVDEWITGGASIWDIWNSSGTELQTRLTALTSGKYDVLFMNAQRPWRQTGSEAVAAGNFVKQAHASNSKYRFLIQVYWTFEQSSFRHSEKSTLAEDLAMYRLGALRLALNIALAHKAPVFVAPVGLAMERVKELAAKGKLQGYKTRAALHAGDGSHLSDLGLYVQALVIHGAAYQDKPHGHTKVLGSGSSAKTLSAADAKAIWDVVQTVLRDTPFSGWYKKPPATFAAFQTALSAALGNWENFDKLSALSISSGTFTGEHGVAWSYTKARAQASWPRLINNTLYLETGGTLGATLPAGAGRLEFIFSPFTAGAAATMELRAAGKTVSTFTRSSVNTTDLFASRADGVKAAGPVKLELVCKKGPCLVDNVIWTDHP